MTGVVARLGNKYGFIRNGRHPEGIYFNALWVRGILPPLAVDDEVSFEIRYFDDRPQAHHICRCSTAPDASVRDPATLAPKSDRLFDWAYLPLPESLEELRSAALEEAWEFPGTVPNPHRPHPILYSYLVHTFGRLVHQDRVLVNDAGNLASFNTGLVDSRYEPIFASFGLNSHGHPVWRLLGFCTPGEGPLGQNLIRNFRKLPETAYYFDDASELLYDVHAGTPDLSLTHIITERTSRWPLDFVKKHLPQGFSGVPHSFPSPGQSADFFCSLGEAIRRDDSTYRDYQGRLRQALDLAVKRIRWNFKTAIPHYYPREKKVQLLLPLCIVADNQVDLALAVEKTESGRYLGHTVFTLDVAYQHARLICRPDSDWLVPKEIMQSGTSDLEDG